MKKSFQLLSVISLLILVSLACSILERIPSQIVSEEIIQITPREIDPPVENVTQITPLEIDPPVENVTQITPRQINSPVNMNTVGNPDAPVKVDVWEDFQCPACKSYSEQIERQLFKNYVETGKVFYTFHHFAFIDSQVPSKESNQAANASMCAGAQNQFWNYKDMLYTNWNGENQGAFSDRRLVAFAESLGLDMKEFKPCFDKNQFKADIDKDYSDGVAMGVSGTPSVFVNGEQITPGYIPSYDDLSNAIDSAIEGQ